MSSKFDHRQFNLTTEQDAIDFLDLIVAKAPQLQKILRDNRLKQASLISRAEFAEGKKAETESTGLDTSTAVEASIGERLSGKVTPQIQKAAASRIEQMRQAAGNNGMRPLRPAPQNAQIVPQPIEPANTPVLSDAEKADMGAAALDAVEQSMVTEDSDDPLNLPEAGQIGTLPVAPPAEQFIDQSNSQGVDLAAMAASQNDEEDLAAAAGTSPSEHAADDGVQSQDTVNPPAETAPIEPTSLVPPADLVPAGDRIASIQAQNKG